MNTMMKLQLLAPRSAQWGSRGMLLSLAMGCVKGETGADASVIKGDVLIPAIELEEAESGPGVNDDPASGALHDLGVVAWSPTWVSGQSLAFSADEFGVPTGDPDNYLFKTGAAGAFTLTLISDPGEGSGDSADTGGGEGSWFGLVVYDRSHLDPEGLPTVLFAGTTAGSGGLLEVPLELTKDTEVIVEVTGGAAEAGLEAYTLSLSGFDPSTGGFKVGLYPGETLEERGLPMGGTTVAEFVADPQTGAWRGSFEMFGSTPVVREGEVPKMGERPGQAWLWAGDFADLNAGAVSGQAYSSNPISVDLSEEKIEGLQVQVDAILPVIPGWDEVEVEPNNVEIDGASYAILSGSGQSLPAATGPGFTDVLRGTLEFSSDEPEWSGENDAFIVTVPEEMGMVVTLSWSDPTRTLDMNWNGPDGEIYGAGWDVADVNPERIDTVSNYGTYLAPGESHTLVILPWSGPAGPLDYELRMEWVAP
jgi:hypothetical protein